MVTPHPLANKHIIVAGGGIAGLAFVRAFVRNWPDEDPRPRITLYERREQHVSPDREGYTISVRSDVMSGGMQALQKLELLDEMFAASVTGQHGGAGKFRIWDINFNPILTFKTPKTPPDGLPVHGMRIARYVLRQGLIDAIPTRVMAHWQLSCTSASELSDGRVQVTLSNGSTDECDLLIAADGANSKVRAALRPNDNLSYAGAVCISATAQFPDGLPDPIKEDHGIFLGAGPSSLFVSPVDDTKASWSVSFLEDKPRNALRGKDAMEWKNEILEQARDHGKRFGQPFSQLVDATNPATLMLFNTMDKQPINHKEMVNTPVVFIGDANHAVSVSSCGRRTTCSRSLANILHSSRLLAMAQIWR